jgi:hypothetical protein
MIFHFCLTLPRCTLNYLIVSFPSPPPRPAPLPQVLMRSRSEDALDAFNLLCAPVDSIRSHFRSSYAMVVNILRTRDLESCKV